MARAIERIEQELAALEDAIAQIVAELHTTYSKYLILLGQAVRQQLIMASFRVCTQGYPEAFLALSFNQRQQLQQMLRQLGKQAQEELPLHLEQSYELLEADSLDEVEQLTEASEEPLTPASEPSEDSEPSPTPFHPSEFTKTLLAEPDALSQWQENIEEAIEQTLQTVSTEVNQILQQNQIVPDKLPPAVLEAASKVEASTSDSSGAANLLNLVMETDSDEDDEDTTLTRIIAINLRLSEIEFADPTLTAGRNQIHNLSAKLSQLQRQYQKRQRERAAAEAEAVWRSSWFED
jgi:hypothetical protein